MTKIPGKLVDLGGQARVLAPINAATFKTYRAEIARAFSGAGLPDIELVAKLAHASLQRNDSEVTLDQVESWVDMGNMLDVFEALMDVSGLVAKAGNLARRLQGDLQTPTPTPISTPPSPT